MGGPGVAVNGDFWIEPIRTREAHAQVIRGMMGDTLNHLAAKSDGRNAVTIGCHIYMLEIMEGRKSGNYSQGGAARSQSER